MLSLADDKYVLRAVKLYSDGALGSRVRHCWLPTVMHPIMKGLLFVADQEMQAMVKESGKSWLSSQRACNYDAGNRQVIESLAFDQSRSKTRAACHRIEHAQILELSDIPRLKANDIILPCNRRMRPSDMK